MGNVTILDTTTKYPITLMGERAGICWGADISDKEKNYKRGLDCLQSGHGRVMEFVNVEMVIDGYSARVIREWYTHLGGAPTRLQASTRYINYGDFNYVVPGSIEKCMTRSKKWIIGETTSAIDIYNNCMAHISECVESLEKECGIPREDAAMLLPLGMTTKIVDKRNLRNLVDMSHQRLCNRAFWEFRDLMHDVMEELKLMSPEWEYIISHYFIPKCEFMGYCPEKNSCGYFAETTYIKAKDFAKKYTNYFNKNSAYTNENCLRCVDHDACKEVENEHGRPIDICYDRDGK